MTSYEQARLTGFLHIVRWDIGLVSTEFGWDMRVMHAHVGGMLGDCAPEHYKALTTQEAYDVLLASIELAGHPA